MTSSRIPVLCEVYVSRHSFAFVMSYKEEKQFLKLRFQEIPNLILIFHKGTTNMYVIMRNMTV